MTLIAAGVSHRTAPLEERERLALSAAEVPLAVDHIRGQFGNGVVLSTCNRTEVYAHPNNGEVRPAELIYALAAFKGISLDARSPAFYELQGRGVVEHLFRVAAGVDSMVLGESQILGQVRAALGTAHEARSLDASLSRLLHDALRTGKRARHETPIARFAVSVSSAAVTLARRHVPVFPHIRALVVGAGEAGKLAARALRDQGVQRITVTSRTTARAADVAAYLGAQVAPFERLREALADADLVITSSSAAGYLIDPSLVEQAQALRTAPTMFIDVAVPRDVDPAIAAIPGVQLFDIDDLQAVSEANLRLRHEAAADVHRIVEAAADEFEAWLDSRRAAPTIKAVVQQAERIRRLEVQRTLRELGLQGEASDKLDRMTAAIVKKILHHPIAYLRSSAECDESAQTVRRIFGVEDG